MSWRIEFRPPTEEELRESRRLDAWDYVMLAVVVFVFIVLPTIGIVAAMVSR